MWKPSIFLLLSVAVLAVVAQNRKCILQDNCEKCLLIDPACAWCTDRNYNLKKPRCMTPEDLKAAGCDSVYQNNFMGLEILQNDSLMDYSYTKSSGSGSNSGGGVGGGASGSGSSSSKSSSSTSGQGANSKTGSGSTGGGASGSSSGSTITGSSSTGSSSSSSSSNGQEANAIQIQPQRLKLSIAKGQTQTFKMTYRPAKNYPLDLYYLMDLTWTMRDDKETLERMANKMANKIHSLTENFRIGFGSFADKTEMPFALMADKYQENPCAPEHATCAKGYGFRHRLNFTADMDDFVSKVKMSEITGNLDNIEGGLDALMQIIVCGEQVGWDEQTRKLIVFATDSKMHLAGEGKLAGIVKRNDAKCHLDKDGEYGGSLEYDYPSLEQIYRVLTKNKMKVIFAVTGGQVAHYDRVHQLLKELSSVGILMMDSSNIIQLIEKGYQEFLKRVHFADNAPENVRVEYWTDCGGLYKELRQLDRCDNIELGRSYEFQVSVTVLDKPLTTTTTTRNSTMRRTWSSESKSSSTRTARDVAEEEEITENDNIHYFRIEESSLSEGIDIELEIRELCGCLMEEKREPSSPLCSSAGDYACGMCLCEQGRGGTTCECDLNESTSDKELEMNCRQPMVTMDGLANVTSYGPVCSETGTCLCGQCHCYKGKTGQFCECADCPRYNGMECGGPDRAYCDCGECVCQNGWTGERCDCSPAMDKCYPPNSNSLCSGKGECKCNSCSKCDFGFSGDFCESKSGADSALCLFYEPCVKCLINRHHNATSCSNIAEYCTDHKNGREFDYKFSHDLNDERIRCVVRTRHFDKAGNEIENSDACEHYFTYEMNEEGHSALVIDESPCTPVNYALFGGFIILATLLMGLMVAMIVKTYFWYTDRRITAEFHKHQNMTKYEEQNPLYKSAWTRYEVPEEYRMSQDGTNRESFVVKETAFRE